MNAISSQLIPKIYAAGRGTENPSTQAALILAGAIEDDFSNPAVQLALVKVSRSAVASENPEVWIAALLADMLAGGLIDSSLEARVAALESGAGGGGGTGSRIAGPFVSSGTALDDARGVVGDWMYDATDPDWFYFKVSNIPHAWIVFAVGTLVPV